MASNLFSNLQVFHINWEKNRKIFNWFIKVIGKNCHAMIISQKSLNIIFFLNSRIKYCISFFILTYLSVFKKNFQIESRTGFLYEYSVLHITAKIVYQYCNLR